MHALYLGELAQAKYIGWYAPTYRCCKQMPLRQAIVQVTTD